MDGPAKPVNPRRAPLAAWQGNLGGASLEHALLGRSQREPFHFIQNPQGAPCSGQAVEFPRYCFAEHSGWARAGELPDAEQLGPHSSGAQALRSQPSQMMMQQEALPQAAIDEKQVSVEFSRWPSHGFPSRGSYHKSKRPGGEAGICRPTSGHRISGAVFVLVAFGDAVGKRRMEI